MELDLNQYTIEQLANMLYLKMESEGFSKGTDKTKWREPIVAEKLGHTAHTKISSGKGTDGYGSDAFDPTSTEYCEYKSQAIEDGQLRNLLQENRTQKNGKIKEYVPLSITGVYNGFNNNFDIASVEYAKKSHYFSIFYKEKCVLVIKVNTEYVMSTLISNYEKFESKAAEAAKKAIAAGKPIPSKTTNLNSVTINLSDKHLYEISYKDYEFFNQKH
jgi:hypothetical protein